MGNTLKMLLIPVSPFRSVPSELGFVLVETIRTVMIIFLRQKCAKSEFQNPVYEWYMVTGFRHFHRLSALRHSLYQEAMIFKTLRYKTVAFGSRMPSAECASVVLDRQHSRGP